MLHRFISIHAESPATVCGFYTVAMRTKELSQKSAGSRIFAGEGVVEKTLVRGPNVGTEHLVLLGGDRVPLRPCDTRSKLFRCGGCKKHFDFC